MNKLAAAPGSSDPYQEVRRQVFYAFRNPDATEFAPLLWPPIYGDAFGSFEAPPGPRVGFSMTRTLYGYLQQWIHGDFIADYDPHFEDPKSLDGLPLPIEERMAAFHSRPNWAAKSSLGSTLRRPDYENDPPLRRTWADRKARDGSRPRFSFGDVC